MNSIISIMTVDMKLMKDLYNKVAKTDTPVTLSAKERQFLTELCRNMIHSYNSTKDISK